LSWSRADSAYIALQIANIKAALSQNAAEALYKKVLVMSHLSAVTKKHPNSSAFSARQYVEDVLANVGSAFQARDVETHSCCSATSVSTYDIHRGNARLLIIIIILYYARWQINITYREKNNKSSTDLQHNEVKQTFVCFTSLCCRFVLLLLLFYYYFIIYYKVKALATECLSTQQMTSKQQI